MKHNIYSKEEFMKLLDISENELELWERLGCVRHLGKVDEHTPLYTEANLAEARRIQELQRIGYDLESIQKIIKKVGLPRTELTRQKGESKVIEFLTVGELAAKTGLNTRTLKYWEERGILQPDGRSSGGFRLYSKVYVYLCNLIKDLQNFGYTLEEIKETSDLFRDFIAISNNTATYSRAEAKKRLEMMQQRIASLNGRMNDLKDGITRWDDLLKKKKKEIAQLLARTADTTKAQQSSKTKKKESKKSE